MKIVLPYAKILSIGDGHADPLAQIEAAARVSHRSEDDKQITPARFVKAVVIDHGDWSVVEHVTASVEFLVDRGITHEIVRHRLFSYTQESTRFVNYQKKMPPSFIYPIPGVECKHCIAGELIHQRTSCTYDAAWLDSIEQAERSYRKLLENGWRPQEARSVFPNALASKLIMTGNLRNWRQFFLMRTSKEAHPQMRQVTIPLLADFQKKVPVLFDDIIPNSRQVDNIAKGR